MRKNRAVGAVIAAVGIATILGGCARKVQPSYEANAQNVTFLRSELNVGGGTGSGSSGGSTRAALPDPKGWATLTGTFKISGSAPQPAPLPVSGDDAAICAPGGKAPLSESVVIGPGNGIRDVLIYLTTATPPDNPAWEHADYAAAKNATVDFDQKACIFLSHVFAMRSTQTLRIINSDPVGHNTKLLPKDGCAPFNKTIPAGGYELHQVRGQEKSPFPVACSIHPWMQGAMITRDNPYFAVSKADGSFEIKNLPAGVPLEFRVWQEKAGFLKEVKLDGKSETWRRGTFTLTLTPDTPHHFEVVVDAAAFQ